jgi:hypothetical protein
MSALDFDLPPVFLIGGTAAPVWTPPPGVGASQAPRVASTARHRARPAVRLQSAAGVSASGRGIAKTRAEGTGTLTAIGDIAGTSGSRKVVGKGDGRGSSRGGDMVGRGGRGDRGTVRGKGRGGMSAGAHGAKWAGQVTPVVATAPPAPVRKLRQVVGSAPATYGNTNKWEDVRKWLAVAGGYTQLRILVLFGPSGVGKTHGALALARHYQFGVREINCGDVGAPAAMQARLRELCTRVDLHASHLNAGSLVLLDDVDAYPEAVADEVGAFLGRAPDPCAPLVLTTASLSLPPVRRLLACAPKGSVTVIRLFHLRVTDLSKFAAALGERNKCSSREQCIQQAHGDMRQFLYNSAMNRLAHVAFSEQQHHRVDRRPNIFELTARALTQRSRWSGATVSAAPLPAQGPIDDGSSRASLRTPEEALQDATRRKQDSAQRDDNLASADDRLYAMLFENYPRASADMEALAVAADTFSLGDTLRHAPSHPCSSLAEDAARRALVGGHLLYEQVVFPDVLRARQGPVVRGGGVSWTTLDGGAPRLQLLPGELANPGPGAHFSLGTASIATTATA